MLAATEKQPVLLIAKYITPTMVNINWMLFHMVSLRKTITSIGRLKKDCDVCKGFDEVLAEAITVNIDDEFNIKIASLHGLFLLKFNAWSDRNIKTDKVS